MRKNAGFLIAMLIAISAMAEEFKVNGVALGCFLSIREEEANMFAVMPGEESAKYPKLHFCTSRETTHKMPKCEKESPVTFVGKEVIYEDVNMFGMKFRQKLLTSIDNQVVGIQFFSWSHSFKGSEEDFRKSEDCVVFGKIAEVMKEKYGDPVESITNKPMSTIYGWKQDSVNIYLALNAPVRRSTGDTISAIPYLSIDYVDTNLVNRAQEVYREKPSDDKSDAEKSEVKKLL